MAFVEEATDMEEFNGNWETLLFRRIAPLFSRGGGAPAPPDIDNMLGYFLKSAPLDCLTRVISLMALLSSFMFEYLSLSISPLLSRLF